MANETCSSPPPQNSSSWPWSGRKRRNSESSLSSLREFVRGRRNSVSAADAPAANVLRKRPPEPLAPKARTPTPSDNKAEENGPSAELGARKNPERRSQSRPPPAFLNKVNHRHTFSASAVLRWYTINPDDDARLRPVPTRFRSSSTGGPPPRFTPTAAPPFLRPPASRSDGSRAMYPQDEQEFVMRTQRASARMQQITGAHQSPRGPDLENAPMIHMPTAFPDSPLPGSDRPGGYNVPRRLSNSSASSATSSVVSGSDGFDGRVRSASFSSSQTSVDSWPSSPGAGPRFGPSSVTWHTQNGGPSTGYPWQRPTLLKPARRKTRPGELFAALPGEVLELILEELRSLHLQPGSGSCATCWMRDCCSVAISARKFLKYAREALYHHIHLVGHEAPAMKKRTKTTFGSRLVLLRRTLRANPQIAVIVRTLKPPARPLSVGVVAYNDLVASVVMACPNLERLVGFYPTYDHSFQRLFQALSTRPKLKEMNWILEPSSLQRQQVARPSGDNGRGSPGPLQPQESQLFLGFHSNWRQLTTLVVHCQPGAALSPANLLECTIRSLPSLQHLYLSKVPHTAFNDSNLLSLPALRKLSLNCCPGISTAGLSALATRPASASLQTLTLMHMNVESLPALARIFSYLTTLETFNLVQTFPPEMPSDEFMMLFPYLASKSLRRLHWDIPYLPSTATAADAILARSMSAGGFPSLRYLCAPHDPEGIFQALCAPRERVDHPADRYRRGGPAHHYAQLNASGTVTAWQGLGHTRSSSSFSSTRGSLLNGFGGRSGSFSGGTPPASPLFPPPNSLPALDGDGSSHSNLHQARLAAQARLEAAQRQPRYFVNVVDERGAVVEKHGVGAFLGTVESPIRYVLAPDPRSGATDEGGGLVSVEDMLRDDGGEAVGLVPAPSPSSSYAASVGAASGAGSEKKQKKSKTKVGAKKGDRERWEKGEPQSEGETGEMVRREGCVGRWNTFSGAVVDKKDRERWWHQERGRWRGVVLS